MKLGSRWETDQGIGEQTGEHAEDAEAREKDSQAEEEREREREIAKWKVAGHRYWPAKNAPPRGAVCKRRFKTGYLRFSRSVGRVTHAYTRVPTPRPVPGGYPSYFGVRSPGYRGFTVSPAALGAHASGHRWPSKNHGEPAAMLDARLCNQKRGKENGGGWYATLGLGFTFNRRRRQRPDPPGPSSVKSIKDGCDDEPRFVSSMERCLDFCSMDTSGEDFFQGETGARIFR